MTMRFAFNMAVLTRIGTDNQTFLNRLIQYFSCVLLMSELVNAFVYGGIYAFLSVFCASVALCAGCIARSTVVILIPATNRNLNKGSFCYLTF